MQEILNDKSTKYISDKYKHLIRHKVPTGPRNNCKFVILRGKKSSFKV